MEFLGYAIGGIFLHLYYFCSWYHFANKKINFKDLKLYMAIIISIILGTCIAFNCPQLLKIILMSLLSCIMAYCLVFHNIKRSIIASIITQLTTMLAELVFVLLTSIFLGKDMNSLFNSDLGGLIINVGIAMICFLTLKTSIPMKIYKLSLETTTTIKNNNILRNSLIMIIVASILTTISYERLSINYILIFNTAITIFYIIILFRITCVQSKFQNITNKYNSSIASLTEYEEMIDRYRIINHEAKSELKTIRSMVINKEKNIDKHIDALLNEKTKINTDIMKKVSKIPQGGLRGIMYSKICEMEKNKIKYNLHIAKDVKTAELINLDEYVISDICKIIGVFLDNAIDEVCKIKNGVIAIEIFKDNNQLIIDITNNANSNIRIDKIYNVGYTTKDNGHGYGLPLVRKIVNNNPNLDHNTVIDYTKNDQIIFTQSLIIKL